MLTSTPASGMNETVLTGNCRGRYTATVLFYNILVEAFIRVVVYVVTTALPTRLRLDDEGLPMVLIVGSGSGCGAMPVSYSRPASLSGVIVA